MERELILSYGSFHILAMGCCSLLKGKGAWLKCLALFLHLNNGISSTNTLTMVPKHISATNLALSEIPQLQTHLHIML